MTADRPLGSRYVLGPLLGRGSTGRVHEARRLADDQRFAVKVLRDDWSDDDEILQRLFQEKRLLESLSHPNVVGVADLVIDDGQAGIVMELVEGGSLRLLMKPGPMPAGQVAGLGHQLAAALEAAHGAGIVHGDVKPENVLVAGTEPDLDVKLSDFGVSRLVDATTTKSVARVGTPSYMAPELITGKPVGRASDVYSLGVLLYEALAGRPPFTAENVQAVWHAHTATRPERPDGVGDAWWTLLERMLAKSADDRPSAAVVAATLAGRAEPDVSLLPAPAAAPVSAPATTPGEPTLLPEDSLTGQDTLIKARPAAPAAPVPPAPRRRISRVALGAAATVVAFAAVGSVAWANGWARDTRATTLPSAGATSSAAPSPSPSDSPAPGPSASATASVTPSPPPSPVSGGGTTVVVNPPAPAAGQTTKATTTPRTAGTTRKAAPADTTAQCKAASNAGGLDIGSELNNSGGPNFVPQPCTAIWLTLTEVHYITYAKACLEDGNGTDVRCGGWVYLNDNGAWNRLLTDVEPGDRWQLYLKAQGEGHVGFDFSG
jgi:serine/threonine protein kinase